MSSFIILNKHERFSPTQKACSGKGHALESGYAALLGGMLGCDPPILPRRGSLAKEIDRKSVTRRDSTKGTVWPLRLHNARQIRQVPQNKGWPISGAGSPPSALGHPLLRPGHCLLGLRNQDSRLRGMEISRYPRATALGTGCRLYGVCALASEKWGQKGLQNPSPTLLGSEHREKVFRAPYGPTALGRCAWSCHWFLNCLLFV